MLEMWEECKPFQTHLNENTIFFKNVTKAYIKFFHFLSLIILYPLLTFLQFLNYLLLSLPITLNTSVLRLWVYQVIKKHEGWSHDYDVICKQTWRQRSMALLFT